jgi:hypothetical protein
MPRVEPGLKPYLRARVRFVGMTLCRQHPWGAGVLACTPAKPEKEGADDLERGRVALKSRRVLKAAEARAKDLSSHERRKAAGHVDHARPSKVDHAAHDVVLVESREETVAVPNPVHDDGIHKAGDAEGVDEVRHQLAPLGHCARDDRGGRCSKGELKVPRDPRALGVVVCIEVPPVTREREIGGAGTDERVGVVLVGVVREAVAQKEKPKRADTSVKQVFEKDVLDILGADAASTEGGKARLHQEDERACAFGVGEE